MYIAANTISVPAEQQARTVAAFEHSAPSLKQFAGFLGFELWQNLEEDKIIAVSQWENKEAYESYINSETFKQHHGGMSGKQAHPHANVSYYTAQKLS